MADLNDGFLWSARNSLIAHLADPDHPINTLCGVEAEYQARSDVLARPALRCTRCATLRSAKEV